MFYNLQLYSMDVYAFIYSNSQGKYKKYFISLFELKKKIWAVNIIRVTFLVQSVLLGWFRGLLFAKTLRH